MGKVWLVVAEFGDCDVPLELFESELGARNVAQIYAESLTACGSTTGQSTAVPMMSSAGCA
jgi:hypothetical protein